MIRLATSNDLNDIVEVHKICFPDSFYTAISDGKKNKLLIRYYKEYLEHYPDMFFVAVENGKIIGFAMGYVFNGISCSKIWMRKVFIPLCWKTIGLVIKRNPIALKKLKGLRHSQNTTSTVIRTVNVPQTECFDLLSIALMPENRGSGKAQDMLDAFISAGQTQGKKGCYLSVRNTNERAISFYKRNGYVPVKADAEKATMFKNLSEDNVVSLAEDRSVQYSHYE